MLQYFICSSHGEKKEINLLEAQVKGKYDVDKTCYI